MKITRKLCVVPLLLLGSAGSAWAEPASTQVSGKEEANLAASIQAKLQNDPDLKNNRIDVAVDNGVVTLKGKVDTQAERTKAAPLARVGGVARVDDRLEVGSEGTKEALSDTAVTAKLKAKILADEVLRKGSISVTTNNGVVTLEGTVPSAAAHQQAVAMARNADGVKRVDDKLRVSGAAAKTTAP